MISKKYLNITVDDLENTPKILKKSLKLGRSKKYAELSQKLGLYFIRRAQPLNALSWLDISITHGCHDALVDKANLHILYAGTVQSDIINTVHFSYTEAQILLDSAIGLGINRAHALMVRLLTHEAKDITVSAKMFNHAQCALTHNPDDFSRSILLKAALEDVLVESRLLMGKRVSLPHIAEHLMSLFPYDSLGESALFCAKLMSCGEYLPTPFMNKKPIDYIKISAESGHINAIYILGRILLFEGKDLERSQFLLRSAFKRGITEAGVILADWLSQSAVTRQDAISLYRQCSSAPHNYLPAQCALVAHQLQGEQTIGLTPKNILSILERGLNEKIPIALSILRQYKDIPLIEKLIPT